MGARLVTNEEVEEMCKLQYSIADERMTCMGMRLSSVIWTLTSPLTQTPIMRQ